MDRRRGRKNGGDADRAETEAEEKDGGRSRGEAAETNKKHGKLIQAESDSTNLGHMIADRTAGNILGDVDRVSGREPHEVYRVKITHLDIYYV